MNYKLQKQIFNIMWWIRCVLATRHICFTSS